MCPRKSGRKSHFGEPGGAPGSTLQPAHFRGDPRQTIQWDDVFETPQAAKQTAELFLEKLPEWNGLRWLPRCVGVEAGSNASESGFGGTIQVPGAEKMTVVGALSEEEQAMSSTARETVAFLRVLTEARNRAGEALNGAAVLLLGDNQGAVRAVNVMNSRAPDVNVALRTMLQLCVEGDFDVVAQWKPRAELAEEDELSKFRDSSDWGLCAEQARMINDELGVEPAVDLFAYDTWHVAARYFSQHLTQGIRARSRCASTGVTSWRRGRPWHGSLSRFAC